MKKYSGPEEGKKHEKSEPYAMAKKEGDTGRKMMPKRKMKGKR